MDMTNGMRALSANELDAVSGGSEVKTFKSKNGNTWYYGGGVFAIKLKGGDVVQVSPSGAGGKVGGKPI